VVSRHHMFPHALRCTAFSIAAASLGLTACATDDTDAAADPTWEEYQQAARRELDGHVSYVVDGDVPVSLETLRALYDGRGRGEPVADKSTVNTIDGRDDVWNADEERDLSYCVSNDFGADKTRAINEMREAARAWEAVANLRFRYVPQQDGACLGTNTAVRFAVRPWTENGACAFFPSGGGCVPRTLVMDLDDFDTNPYWEQVAPNQTTLGVFRHELGHILGLRHEHIRGTTCTNETGTWRDLTAYDRSSVMHYQECDGVTTSDMSITALDAAGVRSLYGARNRTGSSGKVVTASRMANTMETLWVASNGSVQGATWTEGSTWQRYQVAPAGNASIDGGLSVVSRLPGHLELFWVAPNGSVQGAYYYQGGSWQRYELAPFGSASPTAGVTGTSRTSTVLDAFWVAPDGSVRQAAWVEGSTWQRTQLSGPGSASTDADVLAISRLPNHLELFWPASNGSVQGAWWYEGGSWQRYQLSGPNSAAPGASIGGVSRVDNHMEVAWPGPNGSIQGAFWYVGGTWNRYELAPAGSASASTTGGVSMVSRQPDHLETFWVGSDGSVRGAWWYEGGTWQVQTIASAGAARTTTPVAAVTRIARHMELYWPTPAAALDGSFWYQGGAWTRYQLSPNGSALASDASH
jgi:hypothetical protein